MYRSNCLALCLGAMITAIVVRGCKWIIDRCVSSSQSPSNPLTPERRQRRRELALERRQYQIKQQRELDAFRDRLVDETATFGARSVQGDRDLAACLQQFQLTDLPHVHTYRDFMGPGTPEGNQRCFAKFIEAGRSTDFVKQLTVIDGVHFPVANSTSYRVSVERTHNSDSYTVRIGDGEYSSGFSADHCCLIVEDDPDREGDVLVTWFDLMPIRGPQGMAGFAQRIEDKFAPNGS